MSRIRRRTAAVVAVSIVATIGLAYLLGIEAANLAGRSNDVTEQFKLAKRMRTRQILERMNTISFGDTLPDWGFEDIDGNWFMLSELLSERTVVTFLDPGCVPCILAIEQMREALDNPADSRYFVLVSSAGPDILRDFRQEVGIPFRILYDEDGAFDSELNITNDPFNLIVDQSSVIVDILAGRLTADYVREIITLNSDFD